MRSLRAKVQLFVDFRCFGLNLLKSTTDAMKHSIIDLVPDIESLHGS